MLHIILESNHLVVKRGHYIVMVMCGLWPVAEPSQNGRERARKRSAGRSIIQYIDRSMLQNARSANIMSINIR